MKRAVATSNFDLLLQTSSAGVAACGCEVQSAFCQLLHFVRCAIGETHLSAASGFNRSAALILRQTSSVEVPGRGCAISSDLRSTSSLQQPVGQSGNTPFHSSRLRLGSFSVKGEKLTA